MISMRKIASYIQLAIITTVLLSSCEARVWDPVDDLDDLTRGWSNSYVDRILRYAVNHYDTLKNYSDPEMFMASALQDTLSMDYIARAGSNGSGDSVYVICKLLQIQDSIVLTVDGYRYSEKFWVHLFTADEGIINCEGKFHVDFYETGKTTPWAWSEINYHSSPSSNYNYDHHYINYLKDKTITGWY